jgi:hypothetical protein
VAADPSHPHPHPTRGLRWRNTAEESTRAFPYVRAKVIEEEAILGMLFRFAVSQERVRRKVVAYLEIPLAGARDMGGGGASAIAADGTAACAEHILQSESFRAKALPCSVPNPDTLRAVCSMPSDGEGRVSESIIEGKRVRLRITTFRPP